jgi:hypothetical protein
MQRCVAGFPILRRKVVYFLGCFTLEEEEEEEGTTFLRSVGRH